MPRLLALSLVILLAACGPRGAEPPTGALTTTVWEATDIAGQGVSAGITSYVVFEDEGKVTGIGACNRFTGTYRIDADTLRIGPLAATEMDCAPAVMEQEARFLSALEETEGFEITEDGFLLLMPSPAGTPTQLTPRYEEPPVMPVRPESRTVEHDVP